jgi:hypothetical protein
MEGKMEALFAESIKIDESRSVGVTEMADGSMAIRGTTAHPGIAIATGVVRLSAEGTEIARQILNRWHDMSKN